MAIKPGTLCIFTDGSILNGHAGAAAVAPELNCNDIQTTRTEYMGTKSTTTIHVAELKGIALGLKIVQDLYDKQVAVRVMANPKTGSGQYI
jgi:ribonuclease HI